MADDSKKDQSKFGRRGFFTEGLKQFLRPLAETVADNLQQRFDRAGIPIDGEDPTSDYGHHDGAPSYIPAVEVPEDRTILRPPGAMREDEFLDRCLSSGQCVSACPVSAIKLAKSDDPRLHEKPFIDPESQACVVCEDLSCMNVCPSGALLPIPKEDIDMGIAIVNDDLCLRSSGEDCQICVDKCPLGPAAIQIPYEGGTIHVNSAGCTGCGVCQMYCPTDPRAIVVIPPEEQGGYHANSNDEGGSNDEGRVPGSFLPIDSDPDALDQD